MVRELGRAGRDAEQIAVPEAGELQAVVERDGARAPLGAAGLLAELGLAALVLLAGEEGELVGEPRLEGRALGRAARAGDLQQRAPGPRMPVQRSTGERLGVGAQRRAVADRERQRTLAVAEGEPRRGLSLGRRRAAPRDAIVSASTAGAGASKRTGWQREAIVGRTWLGRSVSRRRTT